NTLRGNKIGTDGSGGVAVPNGTGVFVSGATGNTVGGTGAGDGNLIAGNPSVGLYLFSTQTLTGSNAIQGNQIGFASGGVPQQYGVLLYNAANNPVPLSGAGANRIMGSSIANVREFTAPGAAGKSGSGSSGGTKAKVSARSSAPGSGARPTGPKG